MKVPRRVCAKLHNVVQSRDGSNIYNVILVWPNDGKTTDPCTLHVSVINDGMKMPLEKMSVHHLQLNLGSKVRPKMLG